LQLGLLPYFQKSKPDFVVNFSVAREIKVNSKRSGAGGCFVTIKVSS